MRSNIVGMADDSTNLVLEHLRALRSDVAEVRSDIGEIRERLGLLEANYANVSRRMDRVAGDIERIKRRLDLVEA
jgi:predicted nuclease with TOPRIM domain